MPSMPRWIWHKVMREELARFVSADATRWVVIPVDREAVLASGQGYRALVRAIYDALAAVGVRYAPERYNPTAKLQEVRQPEEVLNAPREGTCLDLAAVFCGVCEGNELLPLLIVLKTHALAAVALRHGIRDWNAYDRVEYRLFETGVLGDWPALVKLLQEGSYVAVECTGYARQPQAVAPNVAVPPRLSFEEAVEEGKRRIANPDEFAFAVDIAVARWNWMIESEATNIQRAVQSGSYVDAEHVVGVMQRIGNRRAADRLMRVAGSKLGASETNFRTVVAEPPSEAVVQQVAALTQARHTLADQGAALSAESEFQLGRLAALKRDYDAAEGHLQRSVALGPKSYEAVESLLWLTQARAMHDVQRGDREAALMRLQRADKLARTVRNPELDTMRGYIHKTLAQTAELSGDMTARRRLLKRAAAAFDKVLIRHPSDAGALNGRANVKHMLGDLPGARIDYSKAIRRDPGYAAPHHDVALLMEDWAERQPARRARYLSKALEHWVRCKTLAQIDPGFSHEDLARMQDRIGSLRKTLKGREAKIKLR